MEGRLRTICSVVLLLAAGCRKSEPAARVAPEAAVPLTDATVAYFLAEQGQCAWRRADVVTGASAVIAGLDGDCFGARVAFSRDLKKAAVWFDPGVAHRAGLAMQGAPAPAFEDEAAPEGAASRIFEVTPASGEVRPVALPPLPGPLAELGYDRAGRLTALCVKALTTEEIATKKVLVDGQEMELPEVTEGVPAMAHAFREEAGGWTRLESKPTTTGWDLAEGPRALDVSRELSPSSVEVLEDRARSGEVPKAFADALSKQRPAWLAEEDAWVAIQGAPAPLFDVLVVGETAHTTALLRVANGEKLEALEGLGYAGSELVALRLQGPYLLVAGVGSGTHARLYDLRSRKKLFSSDTARAVLFWPRPLQR